MCIAQIRSEGKGRRGNTDQMEWRHRIGTELRAYSKTNPCSLILSHIPLHSKCYCIPNKPNTLELDVGLEAFKRQSSEHI